MLEFQLPDPRPITSEGITCKLEDARVNVLDVPFVSDFCFCEFSCEKDLLAFAGTSKRERDFYTLYYENRDNDGSTEFFIIKNGVETELVDGVHGRAIENGFIIEFTDIFNTLGSGRYSTRIDVLEFGVERIRTFQYFQVMPFNDLAADGTVRIESLQNGEIEGQFTYNNVPFSIRVYGKLGDRQESFETIKNDTNNRIKEQVHTRNHFEYSLEINTVQHDFMIDILKNYSIGNVVTISDYNIRNQDVYDQLQLTRTDEAATIDNDSQSRYAKYTIKFQDYIQNNIKRPFS